MRYDTNEHKTFTTFLFVKYIKPSRNKSEDSEGEWNVGLSFLNVTFGTTRAAGLSGLLTGRTLLPRKILGTHICQGLSGPQGYCMRTEGIGHSKKFPKTLQGIAPGTSHLIEQCLNQLHRSLHIFFVTNRNKLSSSCLLKIS